jgi:hypothetical protein
MSVTGDQIGDAITIEIADSNAPCPRQICVVRPGEASGAVSEI